MKTPRTKPQSTFDVSQFIDSAATTAGDEPASKARSRARPSASRRKTTTPSSKAKPAADGFKRSSFDLPDSLHQRLKIAAVKLDRPMRDLIEESITLRLDALGH